MYIIIPAYEPDKRLIQVVQDITIKLPKARIIVVNDGSGPGYNDYYDETAFIGATVLTHPINKGKGAAVTSPPMQQQDARRIGIRMPLDRILEPTSLKDRLQNSTAFPD